MPWHGWTLQEHMARYAYALPYVHNKSVLDVGCHIGTGLQMLAWGAREVAGYDVSEYALALSQRRQYLVPTTFRRIDFNTEDFPEKEYEVITSFEVLEHVDDPDRLAAMIAKALAPDGLFIFSVPHMVANHQHKTLFDAEKIRALISRHFELMELHVFDKKPVTGKPCYANVVDYVGMARKKA